METPRVPLVSLKKMRSRHPEFLAQGAWINFFDRTVVRERCRVIRSECLYGPMIDIVRVQAFEPGTAESLCDPPGATEKVERTPMFARGQS